MTKYFAMLVAAKFCSMTGMAQPKIEAIYSPTHQCWVENLSNRAVVLSKLGDTVQVIDRRLDGHIAVTNNGQTVAEWRTEASGNLSSKPQLTFFRAGRDPVVAQTEPSIEGELNQFNAKGWLRGDSLYHRMAENPFFVDGDRLFLCQEEGILAVFDLNNLQVLYAGKGANHFLQNYHSIPSGPFRKPLE